MNPKEFSWTEDQQVTVTNPTSEDFKFKVHGKDYMLAAGRTAKMPGFIAWLYVYGQATKMAQVDKVFPSWNEEGFRNQYYDKFVVGVDDLVQMIDEEPEPEINTFDPPKEPESIVRHEVPKRGRPARV